MDKKRLLGKVFKELLHLIENAEYLSEKLNEFEGPVLFKGTQQYTFVLYGEEVRLFRKVVEDVLKFEKTGKIFSKSYIEGTVSEIIGVVFTTPGNKPKILRSVFNKIIVRLDPSNARPYVTVIPLEGIKFLLKRCIHLAKFEIGVFKKTSKRFREVKSGIEDIAYSTGENKKIADAKIKHVENRLLGKAYVSTQVFGERNKALEIATEDIVGLLDFLTYGTSFQHAHSERVRPNIYNTDPKRASYHLSYSDDDYYIGGPPYFGFLHLLDFDANLLKTLKKGPFRTALNILNKEKELRTDFDNKLVNSFKLFADAWREEKKYSAYLSLMAIFEIFFSPAGTTALVERSIRSNISEGLAIIAYKKYEDRISIIKKLKNLYNQRSAITHGRTLTVDDQSFEDLLYLSRILIFVLLKNYKKFSCENAIQNYLDFCRLK